MVVGTQVGPYRILQQIGEGGMGSVWMAEHTMLGRRAAVKLLHNEYSGRQDIVQRFFNEARAATAIADPGIVQIFDFGHMPHGQAYIVMELLEGEALDRRLQRLGKLPVKDALRIMRQVASSLGAAHARGIVHRDLKPENIFMVRDPEVISGERAKILDFGIAKLGEHSGMKTQTNALMGTPAYMSPEQCKGSGKVDARSDIYALGCLFFSLITGLPPFVADGHGELIVMHIQMPAPLVSSRASHVPASVDSLVARCLAKNPEERFPSGSELAAAIAMLITNVTGPPAVATLAPHQMTTAADVNAPTVTTLAGAAAQAAGSVAPAPPRKGKAGVIAIVVGALVALGVGGAILATRGGKQDAAATAEPVATPTEPVATPTEPVATPPEPVAKPPEPVAKPPEPVVAPPVAKLAIVVESTPSGAEVFRGDDKKPIGTTPYTFELDPATAPFEIKLSHKGYRSQKAKITPGADTKVAVTLKKAAAAPTTSSEGTDDLANPFNKKK
jgi:serine/threonine-protein kinase